MEDLRVTAVPTVAATTRVRRTSCIPRITGTTDVPTIPHVLVYDHLVVKLPDVVARQLMDMCALQLAYRGAVHGVYVGASNEPDR